MYFSMLPKVQLNINDEYFQYVTDITARANFNKKIKELYTALEYYDIENDDTPEIVSSKLYDDPNLHWVLLILNEVIDPRYDWILSQENLLAYVKNKYGDENISDIHHYEKTLSDGTVLNYQSFVSGSLSITNFDYEDFLNEKKRQIIVLKKRYISTVVQEFQKIING